MRKEPGCEEYSLFRNVEDGDRFVMVERWTTQADLDTHLAAARARQAAAPAPTAGLRAGPPEVVAPVRPSGLAIRGRGRALQGLRWRTRTEGVGGTARLLSLD